jgi:predicted ester cyclase
MSTEDNKAIVRRFFAEYDRGNLDGAEEILATDFVNHQADNTVQNREEFKQLGSVFLKAFPNLQETIEDQVAEGDKVATRLIFSGIQSGELMGIPPTGKRVTFTSLTIDRLVDGKIAERWHLFDTLGMMQQLGVIPPMG